MKKLFMAMTILGLLGFQGVLLAQSDRGEATLNIGAGKVTIEYGRPALKGRDISKMISPGQEWRMGSNAPTTLSTDVDLKFGDKLVKKGKYVLRAKMVEKEKWLLSVRQGETIVAEIPLEHQKAASSEEQVTIKLEKQGEGGKFTLHWGSLSISASFKKA